MCMVPIDSTFALKEKYCQRMHNKHMDSEGYRNIFSFNNSNNNNLIIINNNNLVLITLKLYTGMAPKQGLFKQVATQEGIVLVSFILHILLSRSSTLNILIHLPYLEKSRKSRLSRYPQFFL